ncbi:MAG: P-II family nitrogen regulator [Desulfovibrionaceae bacterium]|nr:P-II family nitrogen regulator [Desulfovibrionaceae bacterium]
MDQKQVISTYLPGVLVLTIVRRSHGEKVMRVVNGAGGRGGTIVQGRGTVNNKLAHLLGLDSEAVELIFTLVDREITDGVLAALRADAEIGKLGNGVSFCLDVQGILRRIHKDNAVNGGADILASNSQTEGKVMSQAEHELIAVIVNFGFADDIMDAARKAGATGGTIMNAQGTVRAGEEVKFFGITIVPEKEFIIIVVPKDKAEPILKAIQEVPCLSEPGVGIAFSMDVLRFMQLGKKAR